MNSLRRIADALERIADAADYWKALARKTSLDKHKAAEAFAAVIESVVKDIVGSDE